MSSDSLDRRLEGLFDTEKTVVSFVDEKVENKEESSDKDKEIKILKDRIRELEESLSVRENCLRCGRALGTKPLDVSDEVTEEYFRHLLGQVPFEKTFKLFDGQLLLTFKELSGESIIYNTDKIKSIKNFDEFADVLEMHLIVGMLKKVSVYDPHTMEVKDIYSKSDEELIENTKSPKEAYDNLLRAVGHVKIAIIRRACATFELLLTALIEKGQDTNFYEDAGLL